jgi:hypothetical protein
MPETLEQRLETLADLPTNDAEINGITELLHAAWECLTEEEQQTVLHTVVVDPDFTF